MEEVGRNPGRIIPVWQEFLEEGLREGKGVRGIGEPIWAARTSAELEECHRHESLLNVAFDGAPGWSLLCPYDTWTLSDEVLEVAYRTHPHLSRYGVSEAGRSSDPGAEAHPFAGTLPPPPDHAQALDFSLEGLGDARALAARQAEAAGLPHARALDLVTAVGELVANSVRHGGSEGTLRVWHEASAVVCEVSDRGLIEDVLVGRRRPAPSERGGRGVWLANQLCDLVQIRSGPAGTTVRVRLATASRR